MYGKMRGKTTVETARLIPFHPFSSCRTIRPAQAATAAGSKRETERAYVTHYGGNL